VAGEPRGHRGDAASFVVIKQRSKWTCALHRVRSRPVGQRTGTINQIRGFLIERGIIVRQGVVPLRKALPDILSSPTYSRQGW